MKIGIFLVILLALVISFLMGCFAGSRHRTYTGSVVLDKNDEGDDRITFNLGMEYDEIAKYDELVFKVIK